MAKKVDIHAARKVDLGYTFEGKPVVGARMIVRNTGDGLSNSQAVDPVVIPQGERCIVAFECDIREIRHDPFDKEVLDGEQLRVHIAKAEKGTMLSGAAFDAARKAMDEQQKRIEVAIEEAEGILRLEGVDDPEDAGKPATEKSPKTRGGGRGSRKGRTH